MLWEVCNKVDIKAAAAKTYVKAFATGIQMPFINQLKMTIVIDPILKNFCPFSTHEIHLSRRGKRNIYNYRYDSDLGFYEKADAYSTSK